MARRRVALVIPVVGFFLATAAACNKASDGPAGAATAIATGDTTVKQRLGPAGGTIVLSDGTALTIPKGALAQETELTVSYRAAPAPRVREFPNPRQHADKSMKLDLPAGRADQAPASAVSAQALAPVRLDDRAEMATYMKAFPKDKYEIKSVDGLGKFYIDDAKDVIKRDIARGQAWEAHVGDLVKQYAVPGTTVIDAGAHIGVHTVSMASAVGPKGHVYAFEPQKKLFRELAKNLELNGHKHAVPLRYAVGDAPGMIEMSAAREGNEGGTGVGKGGDKAELRTLDSFPFERVSMMKIDVEGFEIPVIKGAKQTIAKHRPVLLVEILGGLDFDSATPKHRATMIETIQLIESLGYYVMRVSLHDYLGLPLVQ